MRGFKSKRRKFRLYIHRDDFPILRAAAAAEGMSLHDFLLLTAWIAARKSSRVRPLQPCTNGTPKN